MNESLTEDRLPTLSGTAPEQPTPPSEPFDELPTLGGNGPIAPADAPVIAGYEILEEIGRGGMGIVYRARQLRPRRLVALKVLAAGAGSATDRARFDREADVLARLSCPGVVQVYEAGTYADRDGATRPYVALELVPGTSLDRLLRQGVLKPREAAELLLPLARAMQAVHARGIVHRDLKPANVLLQQSARTEDAAAGSAGLSADRCPLTAPKVTDFGLAHLLEGEDAALTRVGQVLGTPSYAAPEQVESTYGAIGPAVDVHALGAILYECLTGRPPFKGASLAETIDQVARLEPVPVRRLRPDVPRDLETICHKCLRKQPAQRYASAADLADDLERFLNGRAISARPVSVLGHAWRGCRRRPLTSALVALLAVLLGGAVFLAAWLPARLEALERRNDAAEAEAQKSRALAVSLEYHSLTQEAAREAVGEPDWPSRTLPKIQRAAALETPLRDAVVLRGHAARCLGATDFVAAPAVPLGFTASQLAAHPKRPVLAVAQAKAWPLVPCLVVLIDVPTGKVVRKLSYVPVTVRWYKGRPAQDGFCALAFSPDGRWLVAGTRTGALVRWDLSRPEAAAKSWAAHKCEVRHVRLDDSALFSAGDDGLRRWSLAADWAATHQSPTTGQPVLAARDLLVAAHDKVHYLNPADLTPRRPAAAADAGRLAVPATPESPAASARGSSLWAFDAATGRQGIDFRRKGKKAHLAAIDELTTSPDGALVVSASKQTGRVSVWDAASAEVVADLPRVDDVGGVCFDPTGRWLAVLNGTELRLTEVHRSAVQTRSALSSRAVLAACWLGEGELACLAGDRWLGKGELSVWRDGSPRVRRAAAMPEARMPVRLAAAAGRLAWTDDKGVSLTDVNDLSERARVNNVRDVQGMAYDGDRLWLTFEHRARHWQGDALRPGPAWANVVSDVVSGLGNLWCVAAGKRLVVVGGRDGCVRVLSPEGAELTATHRLSAGPITAVALDAGEARALVGTADGTLKLLNLDDGRVIDVGEQHRDRVTAMAFLPGGRAVTASLDGDVRLWEIRGERLGSWLTLSLGAPVAGVSATDDGERLAVVLAGERAVRVWHLGRLREEFARLGLDLTLSQQRKESQPQSHRGHREDKDSPKQRKAALVLVFVLLPSLCPL